MRKNNRKLSMENIEILEGRVELNYDESVARYLDYCELKSVRPNTIYNYKNQLTVLKRILIEVEAPINNITKLTDSDAENVIKTMKNTCKNSTINTRITIYKSFFSYLFKKEFVKKNPFKNISQLKTQRKVKEVLSASEIKQIFGILDLTVYTEFRDYCIILLLLESGLRSNEAVSMKINDLHLSDRYVHVRDSKTGERIVPITGKTAKALTILVKERGKLEHDYLFTTVSGTRLSTQSFQTYIANYSKRLGFHFNCHKFRRTFITNAINKGMNVLTLANICGNSIAIIHKYYLNQSVSDIQKAFEDVSD